MKNKIVILTIPVLLITAAFGLFQTAAAQQSGLPDVRFLGEGPGTFSVEPPRQLLVKTYEGGEFLFVIEEGSTYEAVEDERVWSTDFWPEAPVRLFDEERSYGSVEAGCLVNYVQIEDNEDDRRNTWYINDQELQVVDQGWVTYGNFTVPEAGELTLYAEDSVALIAEVCSATVETETPASTSTATSELVASPTNTPESTATALLGVVPTNTNTPSPNATLTPLPTANVIPPTGGGPGPRDIALTGLALLSGLGLVSYGWWRLLRGSQDGR